MKSVWLALLCLLFGSAYAQDKDYFVILSSFKPPQTLAQGEATSNLLQTIHSQGFHPFFIKTDDYPPLTAGLWSMVLGRYDKDTAQEKLSIVRQWVGDAYIKAVAPSSPQTIVGDSFTLNSSIKNEDCFVVAQDDDIEGYLHYYCAGRDGYHVEIAYGDTRGHVYVSGYELNMENMLDSQRFPDVMSQFPIAWIYTNSNKPQAVSFIIETMNSNDNLVASRYVLKLNEGEPCTIGKHFAIYDLEGVINTLNNLKNSNLSCAY